MLTAVSRGRLTLDRLVELMHSSPAAVFRLPPQRDTHVEIDTARRWRVSGAELETRCGWSPFEGMEMTGAVRSVVLRGREVVRDGRVRDAGTIGEIVQPVA
jgi:dihydroorotase-like cyclic amidohydrolase